ncbi:MAG: hypothetical protein ABR905_09560 [Terracidiphilus sp.]|jgi:hypothetical protein
MSVHLLDTVSVGSALPHALAKRENLIAASKNELAFLRYSIILTSRWEASTGKDMERRKELRAEVKHLRLQYSQKIDDIAMTFGIQSAIDATEEVERTVGVPVGMDRNLFATPTKKR